MRWYLLGLILENIVIVNMNYNKEDIKLTCLLPISDQLQKIAFRISFSDDYISKM